MYCYLKARFGIPNGFQNFLRNKNDSDNWIHWDFLLKANGEDVYICGLSREIHFLLTTKMTDEDWRDLILAIKADFGRVGKEKSSVLKGLERWVLFPNKFNQIAHVCADHHAAIIDNKGGFQPFKISSRAEGKAAIKYKGLKQLSARAAKLHKHCLGLSVLTPILAEAFINMVVLMLCKPEVRDNKRQFEAFIRSHIDTKLFDLFYKCKGFARRLDPNSDTFKNFKRVMDKRNNAIHGNCDPEKEKIETVYFEGTRPLFNEPGDHLGKFFETLEKQYEPDTVIKDYEDTHAFLCHLLACLEPEVEKGVWIIMDDPYPGYDLDRKKMGALLPKQIVGGTMQGQKYDDELAITWP